ncbi:unnamed protein product [Ambrosiozyma monospora]|uniref:Unnamed protein product n=1 Tax=Ambrosiozyma monospora TaxID=43982 RepID=A0A9W7DHQ0_AMBMO|nr:unnamed protein product [Ambrosiozyma monospora]
MGVGAVINAFFSTIVEIFLYCIALNQSKGKLVEGSMIGSVLGGVLLLPGTSMCGGAINRKTQRYNPASAGVSSTMLLYSMLAMMSPTILYEIYGQYEVECTACSPEIGGSDCRKCHFFQPSIVVDQLYLNYLRPFTVICAISLFLAYCIGLLFTLKTHAAMIWSTPVSAEKEKREFAIEVQSIKSSEQSSQHHHASRRPSLRPQQSSHHVSHSMVSHAQPSVSMQQQPEPAAGGHDAPNWSRTKSTTILLSATLLYATIAEILVDVVDDVLSAYPIHPKFLGLTIFALVPSTTEFVNAISFAMHGNVALSMEIGSAYALQVCLLQIPVVVLYSCYKNAGLTSVDSIVDGFGKFVTSFIQHGDEVSTANIDNMFTLIFPRWDFFAVMISVYMFTYIYAEGKSNYFKGSILILLYACILIGYYFAIEIDSTGLGMVKSFVMN